MFGANCRNNGVRTFFYPLTDVIGEQNRRLNKRSGCLGRGLTVFGAYRRLRFVRLLTWRSGWAGFGGSLSRIGAGGWLCFA